MHPNVATGSALEVTIVSEPSHKSFAPKCDGRDVEEMVINASCLGHAPSSSRVQKGVYSSIAGEIPGSIFFSRDGATGANIENWDLPNVSVSRVVFS